MDKSIGGWRRCSRPDYSLPRTLNVSNRYTNSDGCCNFVEHNTQPLGYSFYKQSKNKQEQVEQATQLQISSRTDDLVDKQIAIAKLSTKQNPICLCQLWRYMGGRRMTSTWWGSSLNLGCTPIRPHFIHGPPGQNQVTQHHGQKRFLLQINDCGRLGEDIDMSPDPYESRLYKISIKYLNAQNRIRMKSWHRHKLSPACSPNPALKRVGFDLFLFLGQK
jgi:hypothetical protein